MRSKRAAGIVCGLAGAALVLVWACAPSRPDDDQQAGGGNRSPNAFGRVLDNSGQAAAGATVTAYRIASAGNQIRGYEWEPVDSVVTGQDGVFGFDSLASGAYAFVAEKNNLKAFPGYFSLDSDTVLALDTVRLAATRRAQGTFDYRGNIGNWKIVIDSTTYYFSDTLVIQVGLVGTAYRCVVGADKSFMFNFLPTANYKMEVIYKTRCWDPSQGRYYDLYIVNYTEFVADPQHYQIPVTDSLLVNDSVSVAGDSVTIIGKNYTIQYSVF